MQTEAQTTLDKYEKNKPEQLDVFYFLDSEEQKYSNSIELYDAIPKYYWGNFHRKDGKYLEPMERTFVHRNIEYTVNVQPVKLKDKDGVYRDYLPKRREELVEDALRKMACDGRGIFLGDQMGVVFSLYELQKELQRMGHGYKITDIKKAIMICGKANMEVKTKDGSNIVISNFFTTVGLRTQDDWQKHGKKAKAYIRFNPLVTKSIIEKTFRQLDYDACMKYKINLARWLHKRLSHNYRQASFTTKYEILLSTIIRDSGIKKYPKIKDNIYQVRKALDEMKKKEVLHDYSETDMKEGRKTSDIKFTLRAHMSFIREATKANTRHKTQIKMNEVSYSKKITKKNKKKPTPTAKQMVF